MTIASGGISATAATLLSAAIAAVVALGTTFFTEFFRSRTGRDERRLLERRDALQRLEDDAAAYRTAVRAYGLAARALPGGRGDAVAAAEVAMAGAATRLDVAASRVADHDIDAALNEWRSRAEVSFVSTLDVTAAAEEAAWQAFVHAVGAALRAG